MPRTARNTRRVEQRSFACSTRHRARQGNLADVKRRAGSTLGDDDNRNATHPMPNRLFRALAACARPRGRDCAMVRGRRSRLSMSSRQLPSRSLVRVRLSLNRWCWHPWVATSSSPTRRHLRRPRGRLGSRLRPWSAKAALPAEILDQATNMRADLLVIGTHGRSGFERLLLGSVAEKVLRKASCPVITVPPRLPDAVPSGPVVFKRILCAVDFSEPLDKRDEVCDLDGAGSRCPSHHPPRPRARIPEPGRHGERRARRHDD